MTSLVYVVVLNWNGWHDTIACINSLQMQDYPNINLIIVDNGSTDGSIVHIENAIPAVELIKTGANLGFGGGCNVGIRLALERGADYVWLLNSDATADPSALTALVRCAEKNPSCGAVGAVIYESDHPEMIQLWGGGTVSLWLGRSSHRTYAGPIDFISGASLLLRRTAVEHTGLFDDALFFMYWEDTDLSFRLRRAGWQLVVANDARVWHKQSASLGKSSPLLDEYFARSGVRFLQRYAPLPLVSIVIMLGLRIAKRLLHGDIQRVRAVLRGAIGI
jgi:GT2 family glycosyltransferase